MVDIYKIVILDSSGKPDAQYIFRGYDPNDTYYVKESKSKTPKLIVYN